MNDTTRKKISLLTLLVSIGLLSFSCESNDSPTGSYENTINITINDYGVGSPCGGSVILLNNQVYRSYEGGVAPLMNNLDIDVSSIIGNYVQSQINHVELIDDKIWFAISDYENINQVKAIDLDGNEIESYNVGIIPGDFASWGDWIFVANEGNYGASNGSLSMIDEFGNIFETEDIGDVVQSLEVYEDKLIAIVNNSHLIKLYDITEDGLSFPGIEVSTNGSSPREMVIVDNKVYFTNWNTSDVKVLNLFNYTIESSVSVGVMPEGIITDGTTLWVANSGEDTVSEIDISSLSVITYNVGQGPQNLVKHNGDIYVSRTFYNAGWNAFHGSSKIALEN